MSLAQTMSNLLYSFLKGFLVSFKGKRYKNVSSVSYFHESVLNFSALLK